MSRRGNSRETETGDMAVRGWGRGKYGLPDGNGVFFWGDEKVLELVVMVMPDCECISRCCCSAA